MSTTLTVSSSSFKSFAFAFPPFSPISPSSVVGGPRSWFASLARSSVLSFLHSAVSVGYLEIREADVTHSFGDRRNGDNAVFLEVVGDNFWTSVFMHADLGFSEAYMAGDVNIDDLKKLFDLWFDNESAMSKLGSAFNRISSTFSGFSTAFFGQSLARSKLNAIASYDQSNELFLSFLSKEMMYSCALWDKEEGGVRGDLENGPQPDDLERAQKRKIHHVLKAARVKPGHRVLEFGSGWGGLAIEAALSFGCEVDTVTLSKEQKALADARIKEAGLEGRVRVHLCDYRELPPSFEKAFDAFVSIEMIEHVGAKWHSTYFKIVDWALKSKNSSVVVTSTTYPESRYTTFQPEDFSRRYFWPNAIAPSVTALVNAAFIGAQGRFTVERVENHAAHYPRTLRQWARNMERNLTPAALGLPEKSGSYGPLSFARVPVPVAQAAYEANFDYNAMVRKWQYFFAYAASGFARGNITCHMLTLIREGDTPADCD